MPEISIIIPVYKSSLWLKELVQEVSSVLQGQSLTYEIILVDDSSPDDSWEIISGMASDNIHVRGFQLMNNEGQVRATLCGLHHSRGDIVITMDDDFQHRPDQLPLLIKALSDHPEIDCVMGVFEQKKHSFYRNLGSRIINRLNQAAFKMPRGLRSSGFRAMRRQLVEVICSHQILNPSLSMLIFSSTRRVMNISLQHSPRREGKSNYTLRKQFRLAFDNICHASMLPLRLVSLTGIAASGLSLALMIFYFMRYLLGAIHVPGWTTIILLLTFFSGVILFALGVIGEYLFMVLKEVRGRPLYFVRRSLPEVNTSKGSSDKRSI